MPKLPTLHSYSGQLSFDRLLLLIATLIRYPGLGSRSDKVTSNQDSLESVQQHMQQLAESLGLQLPICSVHTLRKDLVTLRRYGILDRRRHDWGYYLGTGAMNQRELHLALNALSSQATYQGDPQARRVYEALTQRLKQLDVENNGELFYPVRTQLNRAIVHTDPEEMMRKQENRDTLFHALETLEAAILQGQAIEIYLFRNLYQGKPDYRQVYPLQLLYYDIAWYLVMEDCDNGHLAISRLDRFKNHVKVLNPKGRGLDTQRQSLHSAHQLLENGWGLNLGNPNEQKLECQGKLLLIPVKVRFFPPTSRFIEEGERRHPKQKILPGPKDETTGEPIYVDYAVKLPERSLREFSYWVFRHMDNAQVLSPTALVEMHRQAVSNLATRYATASGSIDQLLPD